MRKQMILTVLLGLLGALPAQATITVEPGTYQIPAVVRPAVGGGIQAVFNMRSRSELRLRLTGNRAKALKLTQPRGLVIKIRVAQRPFGSSGHAELLEYSDLKDRLIPLHVGNQLKPSAH